MTDLYPATTRDGTDYCPKCHDAGSPEGTPPLGEASYHTPGSRPLDADRIVDTARVFSDTVPAFVVTCDRHEIDVATTAGLCDGWVAVRITTDRGRGHTRLPSSCIDTHPAGCGPDAYDHVVPMGECNYYDCWVCGSRADYYARAPPDPDDVEFPDGAYFCQDCTDDR